MKCHNLFSHPQNTVLELTKLIGLIGATSSTAKVFTTTTDLITKPGLFTLGRDSIKQSVKTENHLVGEKFKFKQWKITLISNLEIQIDA